MSDEDYALIVDGVGVPIGRWSLHTPTAPSLGLGGYMESIKTGPSEFTVETTREVGEALSAARERARPVPFAFVGDEQPILGYLFVTAVAIRADSATVTLVRYP